MMFELLVRVEAVDAFPNLMRTDLPRRLRQSVQHQLDHAFVRAISTSMALAISNRSCILLSAAAHLLLIIYGEWHDRHVVPKYTDVDYRVFSDGVKALWEGPKAQGWLAEALKLPIGEWVP